MIHKTTHELAPAYPAKLTMYSLPLHAASATPSMVYLHQHFKFLPISGPWYLLFPSLCNAVP